MYGVSFCCGIEVVVEEEIEEEVVAEVVVLVDGIGRFVNMALYDDTALLPTSTGATLSS